MPTRRFRPTFAGTVAAVLGAAATVALGLWQLDRAHEKEAAAEQHEQLARAPALHLGGGDVPDAEALESRLVEARGRFEPAAAVWLDNRVRRGIAGYEVVMPLRLREGQARVLVNRGWIAGTGDRRRLPEVTTPREEVQVSGRAVIPGKRIYELGTDSSEGRVWQNLTTERYRARTGIAVLPVVIEQTNDIGDGLLREWPGPERGADINRSYAVQWFALAGLIVVIYIALALRRDAPKP